jgi:hypothetical protein
LRTLARLLLVGSFSIVSSLTAPAAMPAPATGGRSIAVPMTFERNDGQIARQYRFMSRHEGVQALFSARGPDFVVPAGNAGARRVGMRFLSAADSPMSRASNHFPDERIICADSRLRSGLLQWIPLVRFGTRTYTPASMFFSMRMSRARSWNMISWSHRTPTRRPFGSR